MMNLHNTLLWRHWVETRTSFLLLVADCTTFFLSHLVAGLVVSKLAVVGDRDAVRLLDAVSARCSGMMCSRVLVK